MTCFNGVIYIRQRETKELSITNSTSLAVLTAAKKEARFSRNSRFILTLHKLRLATAS